MTQGSRYFYYYSADKIIKKSSALQRLYLNQGTIGNSNALAMVPVPWSFDVSEIAASMQPSFESGTVNAYFLIDGVPDQKNVFSLKPKNTKQSKLVNLSVPDHSKFGIMLEVSNLKSDFWISFTIVTRRTYEDGGY